MENLTLAEIVEGVGGRLVQGGPAVRAGEPVKAVSTDTRTLIPGSLFVPLIGERFDGHRFIPDAAQKGARAVFVDEGHWNPGGGWPPSIAIVAVDDTLRALGRLAGFYRRRFEVNTIGITGSNGKTTTKDMVASILSRRWKVLSNKGNYNNEIGLPLTVLELTREHEALVVEMGMRGMGQIAWLAEIARPQVGIVTNVGTVHVELLGSIENIARAKSELVEALPADGLAVLNADDPRVAAMKDRAPRFVFYGIDNPADIVAREIEFTGYRGTRFKLCFEGRSEKIILPVVGKHHVSNALAAAGAAFTLGFGWEDVCEGLQGFSHTSMRMEVCEVAGVQVINDAYNASPESMRAALQTAKELSPGESLVLVLGDMLELGDYSEEAHKRVGEIVRELKPRHLVAVGKMASHMASAAAGEAEVNVHTVPDAGGANSLVPHLVEPGDTVLVKASRGIGLEKVVDSLLSELRRREGNK